MTLEPLEPGGIYHIYNHAVGNDNLFLSDDNYSYFMKRYRDFTDGVVDTYAYCLLPNHLHLVIEVKNHITIPEKYSLGTSQYVSKQFSNLFSAYSQAFNKQKNRKGNLFISRFRRKSINSDEYLSNIIRYVHWNPALHGLVKHFDEWKYSSYNLLCQPSDTFLAREKVFKWFGSFQEFVLAHGKLVNLSRDISLER